MNEHGSPQDRRRAVRYACILDASWKPANMTRYGDGWVARVLNVSTGGMALHLGEQFPIDTTLTLELHAETQLPPPITVRVAHCSQLPEGTWVIGAEFLSPLTQAQLESLLAEAPVS